MFTGIIIDTTSIVRTTKEKGGVSLTFQKPAGWSDLALGESVATNGICLTVSSLHADEYDCFVMPETLNKTAFGAAIPQKVNLERALGVHDRLSGHFVQGHVDGVGQVSQIETGDDWRIHLTFPKENREYVIYKGSITLNGVSLTVAAVQGNELTVAIIPHTLEHTTLKSLKVGDQVNIEYDMIGKYVVQNLKLRGDL